VRTHLFSLCRVYPVVQVTPITSLPRGHNGFPGFANGRGQPHSTCPTHCYRTGKPKACMWSLGHRVAQVHVYPSTSAFPLSDRDVLYYHAVLVSSSMVQRRCISVPVRPSAFFRERFFSNAGSWYNVEDKRRLTVRVVLSFTCGCRVPVKMLKIYNHNANRSYVLCTSRLGSKVNTDLCFSSIFLLCNINTPGFTHLWVGMLHLPRFP
jgi:hypothetical protein